MIVAFIFLSVFVNKGLCVCYFPVEFQGIFSTQSTYTGGSTHQYSQITILPDGIPVWGVCHSKNDSNVILYDATGGQDCYRCFHITLHLPNVIQIYTEGLDKCYMHEEAARLTCPSANDIRNHRAREIMLYKSRSFTRDGLIDRVFCPFSGDYLFTYDVNDGSESAKECPTPSSSLSTCPLGSEMQLKFTGCKFTDTQMKFQCLGDWSGVNGFRYFALWDTSVKTDDQPQYRCAMYYKDKDSGDIYISFSIDATCTNHLLSPWDGYEQMVLSPVRMPLMPPVVHSHKCFFPQWAHGTWQNIQVGGRNIRWRDSETDKEFELICLSQHGYNGQRYVVLQRDQCGENKYTCIWLKQRDLNVLEFKTASVEFLSYNNSRKYLDEDFIGQKWQTQGRKTFSEEPGCPVRGIYTGVIPDAKELCARLASDCQHPQLMHYTVSSCKNHSQVFEEREYQCLGQWEEAGIMYTYTFRTDVGTYECFAGVMVSENEAYIIEAGMNCQRGLQPLSRGMKLIKQATCDDSIQVEPSGGSRNPPPLEAEENPNIPTPPSWWPTSSRKPSWPSKGRPPTSQPPWLSYNSSSESHIVQNFFPNFFFLLLCGLLLLS